MGMTRNQRLRRKQARRREWMDRQATASRGVSQVEPLASTETAQERAERLAQRTRQPLTIVQPQEQEEEPLAVAFKPFLEESSCFVGCVKCKRWRVVKREAVARGIPVCRGCRSRMVVCPP